MMKFRGNDNHVGNTDHGICMIVYRLMREEQTTNQPKVIRE